MTRFIGTRNTHDGPATEKDGVREHRRADNIHVALEAFGTFLQERSRKDGHLRSSRDRCRTRVSAPPTRLFAETRRPWAEPGSRPVSEPGTPTPASMILNAETTSALEMAQDITKRLEPPTRWKNEIWSVHHHAQPCEILSGDMAMVREVDGAVVFAVGDVRGHGVAPALLAGPLRASLEAALCFDLPLESSILQVLRHVRGFDGRDFATLGLGVLEPDGRVRYLSAGHPHMLISGETGVRRLPPTGRILMDIPGVEFELDFATEQLDRGDYLLAYSDLLIEATDRDDQEFGLPRLEKAFQACRSLPTSDVLPEIHRKLTRFTGCPIFTDDLTMLLVERL